MTGTSELSVVVPSVNGWEDIRPCLQALERERRSTPLEVIVPERCGERLRAALAAEFPWARMIPVSRDVTIPQMRARAFAVAAAPTVAVIEDHVQVTPGWARKIVDARASGARVVGGGIVNAATDRTVDWAAFLCEYSQAVAPEGGPVESLTGNNTAYDRALLHELRDVVEAGRWEDFLHAELRRRGVVLWSRPDIVALHEKHFTVGEYASQRFHYSRAYAGARSAGSGPARRIFMGAATLALPPVLLARIVTRTWRGRAHRRELLRALPLLALFVTAWSAGELVGAWFGAGDALARVT